MKQQILVIYGQRAKVILRLKGKTDQWRCYPSMLFPKTMYAHIPYTAMYSSVTVFVLMLPTLCTFSAKSRGLTLLDRKCIEHIFQHLARIWIYYLLHQNVFINCPGLQKIFGEKKLSKSSCPTALNRGSLLHPVVPDRKKDNYRPFPALAK